MEGRMMMQRCCGVSSLSWSVVFAVALAIQFAVNSSAAPLNTSSTTTSPSETWSATRTSSYTVSPNQSSSVSRTVEPTYSSSSTTTRSKSATWSDTRSISSTKSATSHNLASLSFTISVAPTNSSSITRSESARWSASTSTSWTVGSLSLNSSTATITPSHSVSSTISMSHSATRSMTPTMIKTPSRSVTRTVSKTVGSATFSHSGSERYTRSMTPSQTRESMPTPTQSFSETTSGQVTASLSQSPSHTSSPTRTLSTSPSLSMLLTASAATPTDGRSMSLSVMLSDSHTTNNSITVSPNASQSHTKSRSFTETNTTSISTSGSRSGPSASLSATSTLTTRTVSISISLTHLITKPPTPTTTNEQSDSLASMSLSRSITRSISDTATATQSTSHTINPFSISQTPSPTRTSSSTVSHVTPSQSFTSAITRTPTRSTTTTVNATVTPSITPPPTPTTSTTLRLTPTVSSSSNSSTSVSWSTSASTTNEAKSTSMSYSDSLSTYWSTTFSISTSSSLPTRSRSQPTQTPSSSTTLSMSQRTVSPSHVASRSESRSASQSSSISSTESDLQTISHTISVSQSPSDENTITDTFIFSFTHVPSPTVSPTTSFSHEGSISSSASRSVTYSVSSTSTQSLTTSATWDTSHSSSSTHTDSNTASASHTPTATGSVTTTIDPCNTTFRANASDFIDRIDVNSDVLEFSPVFQHDPYFLRMNRVQLTLLNVITVDVHFNTFLRNFYHDVNERWFFQPTYTGCRVVRSAPVNSSSLRFSVQYDPDAVLRLSLRDNLVCNVTFSTDIFQCQLLTNQSFNFSLAILAVSMDSWLSTESLVAVSSLTSVLSSAMGAVSVLAQSRAGAIMAMSDCQFSIVDPVEFPDNFFGLGIGHEENHYYRGTVIGNLALIGALVIVFSTGVTVHYVYQRRKLARYGASDNHNSDPQEGSAACDVPQLPIRNQDMFDDGVLDDDANGDHFEAMGVDDDPFELAEVISPLNSLTNHGHRSNIGSVSDLLREFPMRASHTSAVAARRVAKVVEQTRVKVGVYLWGWFESAATVRFPSLLIIPISFVFDSTVTASTSLIVHPRESYDRPLGLFAMTVCALIVALVGIAVALRGNLRLIRTHAHHAYPIYQRHRWLRFLLYPRAHWSGKLRHGGTKTDEDEPLASSLKTNRVFKSATHFIYDDVGWPLYFMLEFIASFVVGICLGIGLSERRVCLALSFVCLAPLLAICAMLLWFRPILTRSGFYCILGANLFTLLASILTVAGMVGATDLFGAYPSIFAFVGMTFMLLRSIADYFAIGLWLRYNACPSSRRSTADAVAPSAAAKGAKRRALKKAGLLVVSAVLAAESSSSDESDKTYNSDDSNDSITAEELANATAAIVVHSGEANHSPADGPQATLSSMYTQESVAVHGPAVAFSPAVQTLPSSAVGSFASEIDLVFGDDDALPHGKSFSAHENYFFANLDAQMQLGLSNTRPRGQSQSATVPVRSDEEPAHTSTPRPSSAERKTETPRLTQDEHDEVARYAALRADLNAMFPTTSGGAAKVIEGKRRDVGSARKGKHRTLTVAAPPTDVLRRLTMHDTDGSVDVGIFDEDAFDVTPYPRGNASGSSSLHYDAEGLCSPPLREHSSSSSELDGMLNDLVGTTASLL